MATNPFALIFLLPSLHAWLWLPHVQAQAALGPRRRSSQPGFLGPLLLLGSFALRYDLGLDAPWYLAELTATGYVKLPALVIAVGWLAVCRADGGARAQDGTRRTRAPGSDLRAGRLRETVRRVVLTVRSTRTRAAETERKALEG